MNWIDNVHRDKLRKVNEEEQTKGELEQENSMSEGNPYEENVKGLEQKLSKEQDSQERLLRSDKGTTEMARRTENNQEEVVLEHKIQTEISGWTSESEGSDVGSDRTVTAPDM